MKLQSTEKTISIEYANGKKAEYKISVGNVDSLEKYLSMAGKIDDKVKSIKDSGSVRDLFDLEREVITGVFSEKAWKEIVKNTNSDVIAIIDIVADVSAAMRDGLEAALKNAKRIG